MKKILITLAMMLVALLATNTAAFADGNRKTEDRAPAKVIWDSDMQWDWDDVGALAILNAMADAGEVDILAIGSSTRGQAGEWNPHIFDAVNTYYRRPDIPIGKSLSGPQLEDVYGQWVVEQGYPHELADGQVWDNVISLYRKTLSEQPDTSVVIVTTGYLSNIRDLLMSEPDEYSDLNGVDLINKKVKYWSCMGGRYPGSGTEANFQDYMGHAKYAVDHFPRPIIGTSAETGNASAAGKSLEFTPITNPVRGIYRKRLDDQGYPNTFSHNTWDLIATLVAVRNPLDYFDMTENGTNVITIGSDGSQSNEWQAEPDHGYYYLIQINSSHVSQVLDELIGRLPNPYPSAEMKVTMLGQGMIDPPGGVFDSGTVVTLTALAGNCYEFSNWLGDVSGTDNPVMVTMDEDKNIAAVFKKVDGCTEPDLVAYWPFNQTEGIYVTDSSGNHFDMRIFNTTDIWNSDPQRGWTLKLNGIHEYGVVNELATEQLKMGTFSIAGFIKIQPGSISEWKRIAGISGSYGFNLSTGGKPGLMTHYGNGKWHGGYADSPAISDGKWHHIAMTHDDNTGNVLYVDGEVVLTQDFTDGTGNAIEYSDFNLFKLASAEGSNYLPATLSDFRMYKKVLTQEEVQKLRDGIDISGIFKQNDAPPFELSCFPNPLTQQTTITYSLPREDFVSLIVYDMTGKKLKTLVNTEQQAGTHKIRFDASAYPNGIYYYCLRSGKYAETNKLIINK